MGNMSGFRKPVVIPQLRPLQWCSLQDIYCTRQSTVYSQQNDYISRGVRRISLEGVRN